MQERILRSFERVLSNQDSIKVEAFDYSPRDMATHVRVTFTKTFPNHYTGDEAAQKQVDELVELVSKTPNGNFDDLWKVL